MGESVTKSWFAVLNNPCEHGYSGTPQEICEQLRDEWVGTSTTRTGAWAYCISALGLHHIHMVLEDVVAMRFSVIKKPTRKECTLKPRKARKNRQKITSTNVRHLTKKESRCCA